MIPEAAVEAAAKALSAQDMRDFHWDSYMPDARAALEAAAPHMLAGAWDEGYQAGVREEQPGWTKNPYGPTK